MNPLYFPISQYNLCGLMMLLLAFYCVPASHGDTAPDTVYVADTPPKIGLDSEGWGDRLSKADWAATLTVVSVSDRVNPAMSKYRNMYAVQGYRYSASVLENWKGVDVRQIEFNVDFSACLNRLDIERRYIVFGTISVTEDFQVLSCDDLVPAQ